RGRPPMEHAESRFPGNLPAAEVSPCSPSVNDNQPLESEAVAGVNSSASAKVQAEKNSLTQAGEPDDDVSSEIPGPGVVEAWAWCCGLTMAHLLASLLLIGLAVGLTVVSGEW